MDTTPQNLQTALDIARKYGFRRAEDYLQSKGVLTFGVEYGKEGDRTLAYINMGDTYSDTICCENGDYWVGSWGDGAEATEAEYCEENDVIRCGYCGEYTALDKENWRKVVCEHCGHLVGG